VDILDDMGVIKLSANVFLKVNYSFKKVFFCYCGGRKHEMGVRSNAFSTCVIIHVTSFQQLCAIKSAREEKISYVWWLILHIPQNCCSAMTVADLNEKLTVNIYRPKL